MRIHHLEREQRLDHPIAEVFALFAEARNLELITPAWLRFEVRTPEPIEMGVGTLIEYRLRVHGVPLRWVSRIEEFVPGVGFTDRQVSGPYRHWRHRHLFRPVPGGTVVADVVDYALPWPPLGDLAHLLFVRRDLERIFDFRRSVVPGLLA